MNTKFKSLALILALTTATTQPMLQAIKNACYGKAVVESRGLGLKKLFTPGFKLFTPQFLPAVVKNHPYLATLLGACGVGFAAAYLYKKYFTQAPKRQTIAEPSEEEMRAEVIKKFYGSCALLICDTPNLTAALRLLSKQWLETNENGECSYSYNRPEHGTLQITIPVTDILKYKGEDGTLLEMAQKQQNKPEITAYIQGLYKQHGLMPTQQQQKPLSSDLKALQAEQDQALAKAKNVLTGLQELTATYEQPVQQPQQSSSSTQGQEQDQLQAQTEAAEQAEAQRKAEAEIAQRLEKIKQEEAKRKAEAEAQRKDEERSLQIQQLKKEAEARLKTEQQIFEKNKIINTALLIGANLALNDLDAMQKLIAAAENDGTIVAMLKHRVSDAQTPYLKNLAQIGNTYYEAKNLILALYEKYKDQLK